MLKIISIDESDLLPLYLLPPNACKFPVQENHKVPGHWLFCAKGTRAHELYCTAHKALCWKPRDQERRRGR